MGCGFMKLHRIKYSHARQSLHPNPSSTEVCLVTHLFLPPYDSCELGVDNVGVKFTAHESGTLIVLDVALVH